MTSTPPNKKEVTSTMTSSNHSNSNSSGGGGESGGTGDGVQVPLVHDSLTFEGRQSLRLQDMEKRAKVYKLSGIGSIITKIAAVLSN